MTAVNAGRVELDLVAIAKDQVTATLREVNKSLAETKRQMDGLDTAQRNELGAEKLLFDGKQKRLALLAEERRERVLAERAARANASALKDADANLKVASQAQEKFNKVLGLAGFVGAGIAAIEALVDMAVAASDYGEAMADVERTQERFNQLLAEIREGNFAARLAAMGVEDAKRAKAQKEHNDQVDKYMEMQGEIEKRRMALLFIDREIEEIAEREVRRGELSTPDKFRLAELEDEKVKKAHEQEEAIKAQAEHEERLLRAAERLTPEFERQANASRGVLAVGLMMGVRGFRRGGARDATFFGEILEDMGSKDDPKPKRGGGRKSDAEEYGKRMAEGQTAAIMRLNAPDPSEMTLDPSLFGEEIDIGKELARAATDTADASSAVLASNMELWQGEMERARESSEAFADSLRDGLVPAMGEMGDALANSLSLWEQFASGQINAKDAALGTVAGLGLAAAEEIKNDKARAAVKGIIYMLEGGIHVLTPGMQALGAAELINGAAMIAFGGGGGGGGGGRGGGGGSAPSRLDTEGGGRGAPATVVYNVTVAPGTDPQSVARELTRTNRSAAGTGIDRRQGW